jgi:hypothetical protein
MLIENQLLLTPLKCSTNIYRISVFEGAQNYNLPGVPTCLGPALNIYIYIMIFLKRKNSLLVTGYVIISLYYIPTNTQ